MEDEILDSKLKNIILILQQQKRTQQQIKMLEEMTLDVPFFQQYRKDGKEFIHKRCCALMGYESFKQGEHVFHIDTFGDKFYIILQGSVGVYIRINKNPEQNQPNSDNQNKKGGQKNKAEQNDKKPADDLTCVKELKDGMSFGELALLQNKKRLASIICHSDCHVAILDKQSFVQVLGESEEQKILKEMSFFADLPFFEGWNFNLLKLLYLNSELKLFTKGQIIFQEGTESSAMFFIKSGEFELFKQFNYDNVRQAGQEQEDTFDINEIRYNKQASLVNPISKNTMRSQRDIVQFDQKSNEKESKAKISTSSNNKNKIGQKDPLGKTIKLCILTEKEMFGEEDIIQGKKRSFGVRCVSFHGELIMIKLRDFQNRIMNDSKTKQLIHQRLDQKMQMMDKKVNQLEKSMNLFSDYYFPQSNIINTFNSSSIPLFRNSSQNQKAPQSDSSSVFNSNLNIPEPIQQQQLLRLQSMMTSKMQRQDSQNLTPQHSVREQPELKKAMSTKNLLRSTTIHNVSTPRESSVQLPSTSTNNKLSSQKSFLFKFPENNEEIPPPTENVLDNSSVRSSQILQQGRGLSRQKNKSICLQKISSRNVNDSDFIQSPLSNFRQTIEIPYLGLLTPTKTKKDSQLLKSFNSGFSPLLQNQRSSQIKIEEPNEKFEMTKCVSFRLTNNAEENQNQTNNLIADHNFESQRSIDINLNLSTKSIQKIQKKESSDEVITNQPKQIQEFSQASSQSHQNSFHMYSDQPRQSSKNGKDEKVNPYENSLTEGFYKNLRVNYLNKFKNQNIQNLKKHIQSTLIDKMPEKFQPLDNYDLKKMKKKKESKFSFEDDKLVLWYKEQMRNQEKIYKEIRSQSQNNKNSDSKQKLNQLKDQEKVSNSPRFSMIEENPNKTINSPTNSLNNNIYRIHGSDQQSRYSVTLQHKRKLSENLVIETDLVLEDEKGDQNLGNLSATSGMKKNNSFTITRKFQKPSSFTSRAAKANFKAIDFSKSFKQNENNSAVAQCVVLPLQESQLDSTSNSKLFQNINLNNFSEKNQLSRTIQTLFSPKKYPGIQNLYDLHVKKNDNSSIQNSQLLQNSSNKHNSNLPYQRQDSSESDNSQQNDSYIADTNFLTKKAEETKQTKKPKGLNNIQTILNQGNRRLSVTLADLQKSPKSPYSPFSNDINQILSELKSPKSSQFQQINNNNNNQFNLNGPNTPTSQFQNILSNSATQDHGLFKNFKQKHENKKMGAIEKQLIMNNSGYLPLNKQQVNNV